MGGPPFQYITSTDNGNIFVPNDPEIIVEKAMVVAWEDGDDKFAVVIPIGTPTSDSTEVNLNRSDTIDLPLSFTVTPDGTTDPWWMLSNDFALGASS